MTSEFIDRVKRDYAAEKPTLSWESYLAGYMACLKRFGGKQ